MKRNFIALCALLLAACGSQEPKITLFSNEAFQTEADGKPVGIYTLRAGDVTMQVTNYGYEVLFQRLSEQLIDWNIDLNWWGKVSTN